MEKIVSEKNILLKQEFNNAVYDAIGEGILKTAKNHSYKKYDIAKLIMAFMIRILVILLHLMIIVNR